MGQTLLLSEQDVRALLPMEDVVAAVEKTFRGMGDGTVVNPSKVNLDLGEIAPYPPYNGFMNAMPAYVGFSDVAGLKWAGGNLGERKKRGIPYCSSLILLVNPHINNFIAVLDGALITNMRTGAQTAVALKYLLGLKDGERRPIHLGIYGAGMQGHMQTRALCQAARVHRRAGRAVPRGDRLCCRLRHHRPPPPRQTHRSAQFRQEEGITMQTVHAQLFSGITDEQQQRMLVCFGVREESFLPEDLIYDFNDRRNIIGLIISGTARVERVDERGVRTILEHLERESVFGEMLMFDNIAGDSLTVVCEKDCRVWFIPADHLVHPCENACAHHSQMIQNMFRLVAEKASALSERVEVLSRRSIRDKLLCYFAIQSGRCGGCFTIPFSLSTLADYISADRSAMMRELKKMREAGLVEVHGRQVCVLQ